MKSVVVIGGGTGSYTVLKGLKKYDFSITAIATMFDSGGSTGRLKDGFGILPPGDLRRCLVALADEKEEIMRKLFTFRFEKESCLDGHSFGNLFLTALTKITGSETDAIKAASNILRIKGRVLPVSTDHSELCAELEDGTIIKGEANIDIPKHDPSLRIRRVFLEPGANATLEARQAILEADMIVLAPGDLYTSIIPNLLVSGINEAIRKSSARKAYICNLMTKKGETTGFTASMHVKEIMKYLGMPLDIIVCNSAERGKSLLAQYAKEGDYPVEVDMRELEKLAPTIIRRDLISRDVLIRHDSSKLAGAIASVANGKVLILDLDDTLYSRTEQLDQSLSNLAGIRLFDGVKDILLNPAFTKILVTRGDAALQRRKLEVLGIGNAFDSIFICRQDEEKRGIFMEIAERLGRNIAVVGNRIDSEIRYGKELGFMTILIRHGHYAGMKPKNRFEKPDFSVDSFEEILPILEANDGFH